ncbi:MAG TPA: cytochrome c biogenesis protein CcsA [Anaerolineales bacterium]|nr:cytochrome c biogenesis protein CcsA [Anaerolineales bacterium]
MSECNSETTRSLDSISVLLIGGALFAAILLYLLFYAPIIARGVESNVASAEGIIWLKAHIVSYWISYFLFFVGLLLAIFHFFGKAAMRFFWIDTITITATILAVVGLITGVLYSKFAWNAWWVWDVKQTVVLLDTLLLVGISFFVVMTRLFSNPLHRKIALVVLLFMALASCIWSFMIEYLFPRIVHPQWFPSILIR